MAIFVKLLEVGGLGPPPSPWPSEDALDPKRLGEGDGKSWRQLCGALVQRAQKGRGTGLEIFLCASGATHGDFLDRATLGRLLELARNHAWGARVYLVTSRQLSLRTESRQVIRSCELWLRAAFDGRAHNVLEVDYDPTDIRTLRTEYLRAAVDAAEARQLAADRLARAGGRWRCVLVPKNAHPKLEELLSSWLSNGPMTAPESAVVVVDALLEQAVFVRRALRRHSPQRCQVVTLCSVSRELKELCASEGLEAPIWLEGELELWYFLRRLDELAAPEMAARHATSRATGDEELVLVEPDGRVQPVEALRQRVFSGSSTQLESPSVVITSAFDPSEARQYLEAAKDVGRVIERYRAGARLHVEPAVSVQRLLQVMDRLRTFDVWVHLGHGTGREGLWDVDGNLAAPERWLQCFAERLDGLSLAVFLTCSSAPIARLFAEAGLPVAIGFEREVEADLGRELLADVLDSLAMHGTRQEEILRGFRRGYHRISVQEAVRNAPDDTIRSRPIAYYSRSA